MEIAMNLETRVFVIFKDTNHTSDLRKRAKQRMTTDTTTSNLQSPKRVSCDCKSVTNKRIIIWWPFPWELLVKICRPVCVSYFALTPS